MNAPRDRINRIIASNAGRPDWPMLEQHFASFGYPCSRADLQSVEWCIKKLAQFGYAVHIRHETAATYLDLIRANDGKEPAGFHRDMAREIERRGGAYFYILSGGEFSDEATAAMPILGSINQVVVWALYSVCRLSGAAARQAKERPTG